MAKNICIIKKGIERPKLTEFITFKSISLYFFLSDNHVLLNSHPLSLLLLSTLSLFLPLRCTFAKMEIM